MRFTEALNNGSAIGWQIQIQNNFFFFGNRNSKPEILSTAFSDFKMHRLHQVHGSDLVEAAQILPTPKADAHWSSNCNNALLIATADCLPILIGHPKFVCAIHAGWRGIKSGIVTKTLHTLIERFGDVDHTFVVYGPHIGYESFEVDQSLAREFVAEFKNFKIDAKDFICAHASNDKKAFVNLEYLLAQQLKSVGIKYKQVLSKNVDTAKDHLFYSYRRDREQIGRNFSFVARLNP